SDMMLGSRWMRTLGSPCFSSCSKIRASDSLASTKTPYKEGLPIFMIRNFDAVARAAMVYLLGRDGVSHLTFSAMPPGRTAKCRLEWPDLNLCPLIRRRSVTAMNRPILCYH